MPDGSTILVLSNAQDATANAVSEALTRRGARFERIDVGDFPSVMTLNARHDGAKWTSSITYSDSGELQLSALRAVYYRRPTRFRMPAGLSDGDETFARAEARLGFGGILATIEAQWVNNPFKVAIAEYKPLQLQVAAFSGLAVPRTLVTNDYATLQAFSDEVRGKVICKAFSSLVLNEHGVAQAIYTSPVDIATIDPAQLRVTTHLFQEWVPKAFEVRVTMIGSIAFAAAIHARSGMATVDWRSDYSSLDYSIVEPPPAIMAGMKGYLDALGLNFGAFDFVVKPDGTWIMLECNPAGQWLWLEETIGLSIADGIAEFLMGDVTR